MKFVAEKQCKGTCGLIKPMGAFARCGKRDDGSPKYNSWCKMCFNTYQQQKRVRQSKYQSIYTEEFLNKVHKLFNQGLGKSKISKELNVHKCKIERAYIKLGLKNSEATRNKQNPRTTHLQTEKSCKDCRKILSVEKFNFYIDNAGRKRIKYICKDHEQKRNNERIKKKLDSDISFKLRRRISSTVWLILKKSDNSKHNYSILQFLPYTILQLRHHIELSFESWMSWDNWGNYNRNIWNDNNSTTWTWQLDHIVPQSDLPYKSMKDENFKKCWSLDNLRPYPAKLNISDGARKVRHKANNIT